MRLPFPFRSLESDGFRRAHGPRAVTLVELLVVMAVGVVVAGLILGILIQTNHETDQDLRRERILSTASSALAGIVTWCERARGAPVVEGEEYLPDRIRLNVLDPETARPGLFELEPLRDPRSPGMDVKQRFRLADSKAAEAEIPFRSVSGDATVWVMTAFKYAWDFDGLIPKWDPAKAGKGRPRAVQITVFVQDEHARARSVRLTTVVDLQPSS